MSSRVASGQLGAIAINIPSSAALWLMAYLKRGIGFVDRFNEPIRGKGPPCIPNLGKRALSLSSVPKSARKFIQRGKSVVTDYIFQL